AQVHRVPAARITQGDAKVARDHSRRGARSGRRFQLQDSRDAAREPHAHLVRGMERPPQPVPDDALDTPGARGRAHRLQELEGNDSLSIAKAAATRAGEAIDQGAHGRATQEHLNKATSGTPIARKRGSMNQRLLIALTLLNLALLLVLLLPRV